ADTGHRLPRTRHGYQLKVPGLARVHPEAGPEWATRWLRTRDVDLEGAGLPVVPPGLVQSVAGWCVVAELRRAPRDVARVRGIDGRSRAGIRTVIGGAHPADPEPKARPLVAVRAPTRGRRVGRRAK